MVKVVSKFRLMWPGMRVQLVLIDPENRKYQAKVFQLSDDQEEKVVRIANFEANSNHHAKYWMRDWLNQYFPKEAASAGQENQAT